ncbi:MAG: hydroxyisourate hydrolase [Gemmatimonadota bacterium]|nr:hydroxyisourate hydrolase [Gemmatimonadota bacterium]
MSAITTHVLDVAAGRPAAGIGVILSVRTGEGWRELARAATDDDGRVAEFPGAGPLERATYRLRFETGDWLKGTGRQGFWPHVEIAFDVEEPGEHHHVPLLLSPYGYSTYRGS